MAAGVIARPGVGGGFLERRPRRTGALSARNGVARGRSRRRWLPRAGDWPPWLRDPAVIFWDHANHFNASRGLPKARAERWSCRPHAAQNL